MPPRPLAAPALAAVLLIGAGCGVDFAPQFRVEDVRVLGIRAEVTGADAIDTETGGTWSDAAPGQTLQLEALVANLDRVPGARITWKACVPTGEAQSPCLEPQFLRDPTLLDQQQGVRQLRIPDPTRPQRAALDVPREEVLAPAFRALLAQVEREPSLACTLYLELPVLVVVEAGDVRRTAVKRVRVVPSAPFLALAGLRSAYRRNTNPELDAVRILPSPPVPPSDVACEGPALIKACTPQTEVQDCGDRPCVGGVCASAVEATVRVALCPAAAQRPQPAQAYSECSADGTQRRVAEGLEYQWYASAGNFPGERTGIGDGNVTGRVTEFERPGGPFTMWVIVRDERGGEDWLAASFR